MKNKKLPKMAVVPYPRHVLVIDAFLIVIFVIAVWAGYEIRNFSDPKRSSDVATVTSKKHLPPIRGPVSLVDTITKKLHGWRSVSVKSYMVEGSVLVPPDQFHQFTPGSSIRISWEVGRNKSIQLIKATADPREYLP